MLSADEAKARRKSDTVFIFGSGYSLHEIQPAEWAHFGEHDVFGFNAFYYQHWIDVDFHLLRGLGTYGELRWKRAVGEAADAIRKNPHFARTAFVVQGEYFAQVGNQLVGYRLLPAGAPIFRYHTNRADGWPTTSFEDGLRHTTGTLIDVVNCAFLFGWRHLVLVGVDLYDARYFWLKPDETLSLDPDTGLLRPAEVNIRGIRYDERHNTAVNGVVQLMAKWREWFEARGVTVSVYNPKSLLAGPLPVYPKRQ